MKRVKIMDYEKLKEAIINCYEGVKEIDNGYGRGQWDKEDFTEEEKAEIADEIIRYYKDSINAT